MNNEFEQIVPWNGAQDTGRDVRLKWQRNFERIKSNFEEISDSLKGISLEELQKLFLRKDQEDGIPPQRPGRRHPVPPEVRRVHRLHVRR